MSVSIRAFGSTKAGQPVQCCTLSGPDCTLSVLDWGATLQSVQVPGPEGPLDLVLGCDTMEAYEAQTCYLGAFVGRVANRIDGGCFDFEGTHYALAQNDAPRTNTLHGGNIGWDKQVFQVLEAKPDRLVLGLVSPSDDEGFPGEIQLTVTYSLIPGGFALEWSARSDQASPLAPTCHAYWNLAGHSSGPVYRQQLQLWADGYTPIGKTLIPLGRVEPVEGTPFDFRQPKPLGQDLCADDPQLHIANGYDHNFAIRGSSGSLRLAARAFSPESGITMTLSTTLPGVQLYTANFVDLDTGKSGACYRKNSAFCLEPQYFPSYLTIPAFESGTVRPDAPQHHRTEWVFSR